MCLDSGTFCGRWTDQARSFFPIVDPTVSGFPPRWWGLAPGSVLGFCCWKNRCGTSCQPVVRCAGRWKNRFETLYQAVARYAGRWKNRSRMFCRQVARSVGRWMPRSGVLARRNGSRCSNPYADPTGRPAQPGFRYSKRRFCDRCSDGCSARCSGRFWAWNRGCSGRLCHRCSGPRRGVAPCALPGIVPRG